MEPDTGNLKIKSRIDYESLDDKTLTFDLIVYDAGVPQKSATASVVANILNVNDETPRFQQLGYAASVMENSPSGTPILSVRAVDLDQEDYGRVTYSLAGAYKDAFAIGIEDGIITVVQPSVLDRESTQNIILQVLRKNSTQKLKDKSALSICCLFLTLIS